MNVSGLTSETWVGDFANRGAAAGQPALPPQPPPADENQGDDIAHLTEDEITLLLTNYKPADSWYDETDKPF